MCHYVMEGTTLTCPACVSVATKHVTSHTDHHYGRALVVTGGVEGRRAVAVLGRSETPPPRFTADLHRLQVLVECFYITWVTLEDF